MPFFTYILFSSKLNRYYIGHTQNLKQRLIQHNSPKGTFTSRTADWMIIFSAESDSRSEAMSHEKQIKARGAARFLALNAD